MTRRIAATAVTSVLVAGLLAACGSSDEERATPRETQAAARVAEAAEDTPAVAGVSGRRVEVVAVGDIVCDSWGETTSITCRHAETAALTQTIDPDAVLALGDLQYQEGELEDFQQIYAETWGELNGITYPTPGNHEYETEDAAGYFTYFSERTPASPGYYAFELGKWRAYSINGNCAKIDCAKQAEWLRADLAENPRRCAVMFTHFPRYSSGAHGDAVSMTRFFRIAFRNRVDLMLAGHDHNYERFARMDHAGELDERGVMSFVSGAGGKNHRAVEEQRKGSRFVDDDTFGVLRLVLRPDSFRFGFRGIDGSSQDNGTRSCS